MSEATVQARLMEVLAPLVAEGSVLLNDHATPQTVSRERGPWLVVETGDGVRATTPNYSNVEVTYEPYVAIVYMRPGNGDEADQVNGFQALRQAAVVALLDADGVDLIETVGPLAAYFDDESVLFQRLRVRVTEYEV